MAEAEAGEANVTCCSDDDGEIGIDIVFSEKLMCLFCLLDGVLNVLLFFAVFDLKR